MTAASPSVVCTDLSFAWPDGVVVLDGLDVAFPAARTGLIGRNGSGKSTLLRLVAGELSPTGGSVAAAGDVAALPQQLPLQTGRTVADLLGIARKRRALHAITSGDADPAHFAVIGDDWDVEARALETLARLHVLTADDATLDRPVGTLSGGEAVLVAVAGLLVRRPAISLLDEPTNNLDRRARRLLYDAVATWPGVLVVVSHDRELLERVDAIVEIRDGAARTFTGPFSAYAAAIAVEQEAAERRVRTAEGELAREHRQYVEAQVKLARRQRTAHKAAREKRVPKIVANNRKSAAEVSAAKYRQLHTDRLAAARRTLGDAERDVRADERIRVELPGTAVPAGRTVLQLGDLVVRGPERIAVVGPNGAGKTTLLEAIVGHRAHPSGVRPVPAVPVGYLPQRLDGLDDQATVLDNIRAAAPLASPHDVRAQLARFLLRGDKVQQPAGALSGGERFRVSLLRLLLADPAPQLLLLDEPTNSLDIDSVAQLADALAGYRGALIVASHDEPFLADVGIRRRWQVSGGGLPVDLGGSAFPGG
jgi:ATPase subunit of ABC transporter with duplicated ATPase domains